jgi:hypothetical protein
MNKITVVTIAALTAATLGVSVAMAAAPDFIKVDANNDHVVSYDEARGAFPTLAQGLYDQADANKDGSLDEAEFGSLLGLTAGLGGDGSSSNDSSSQDSSSSDGLISSVPAP